VLPKKPRTQQQQAGLLVDQPPFVDAFFQAACTVDDATEARGKRTDQSGDGRQHEHGCDGELDRVRNAVGDHRSSAGEAVMGPT
jgi:hypothetical protein